jgi:Vacuolar import and degradation protein
MESLTFRLARGEDEAEDVELEFAPERVPTQPLRGAAGAPPPWPVLSAAHARPCSFLSPGAVFVGEQSCGEADDAESEHLGWLIRVRCDTVEPDGTLTGLMVALPRGLHVPSRQPLVETFWQGCVLRPDGGAHSCWETVLPNGRPGPGRAVDYLHWSNLPGFGDADLSDFLFLRLHEERFVKKESGLDGIVSIAGYYYLCLNRRNGTVNGFYCDAEQSSPGVFQRLLMRPASPGTLLLERQERVRHRAADGPLSFSAPLAER